MKKLFKSKYEQEGHFNRIGADFLIDENGIIQTAYYGKFVGYHLRVEDIVEWMKRKKAGREREKKEIPYFEKCIHLLPA